jgi:hypothetical protein
MPFRAKACFGGDFPISSCDTPDECVNKICTELRSRRGPFDAFVVDDRLYRITHIIRFTPGAEPVVIEIEVANPSSGEPGAGEDTTRFPLYATAMGGVPTFTPTEHLVGHITTPLVSHIHKGRLNMGTWACSPYTALCKARNGEDGLTWQPAIPEVPKQ